MSEQMTLNEVLGKAVQREIDSQRLYTELGNQVKEDPIKYAFKELVKQEMGHQEILEQYIRGGFKKGALDVGQVVDYKIAEKLDHPQISPGISLKDTFLLAANREKLSHEFYLDLAAIHPAGDVKKLLNKLAVEELRHKEKVEFLFTQVAFPQTDGG